MRLPYLQGRVYRVIKEHGPITRRQIADLLGLDKRSLSQMLCCMRAKGSIASVGKTHKCLWSVVGKPPKDMRGKHPGSAVGRNVALRRWPENLAKANRVKGYGPTQFGPKYTPTHALDQCWPVGNRLGHGVSAECD